MKDLDTFVTLDYYTDDNTKLYSNWKFEKIDDWNTFINNGNRTQIISTVKHTIGKESI
jgi:hypothetical protein